MKASLIFNNGVGEAENENDPQDFHTLVYTHLILAI